jgi:uncharacterized protein YdaU (DUF1376 family)
VNYYKHHIGDYRRDTAHLSLLEHGIYRQLMDTYYLSEEPIPSETEQVMRRLAARTEQERTAVEMVLSEFFLLVDGVWKHARCDAEIEAYHRRAEASASNGKHGGRPPGKPSKTKQVNSRVPNGKATTNHKPITNISPSAEDLELFERFYTAYPRKVGKVPALRAFVARQPTPELVALMIAAIEKQGLRAKCQSGDAQFVPHPATWLNAARWEDEPDAPADNVRRLVL